MLRYKYELRNIFSHLGIVTTPQELEEDWETVRVHGYGGLRELRSKYPEFDAHYDELVAPAVPMQIYREKWGKPVYELITEVQKRARLWNTYKDLADKVGTSVEDITLFMKGQEVSTELKKSVFDWITKN